MLTSTTNANTTVAPGHFRPVEPKNDAQAHEMLLAIAEERTVYDADPTGGSSSPYGF